MLLINRHIKTIPAISLIAFFWLACANSVYAFGDSLEDIHQDIKQDYRIKHINHSELSEIKPDSLIIFDVRRPIEYQVSHIDNAIQVDPKITASDFFDQFGDELEGKTAVFYCSVGRRSSKLLSVLDKRLSELGVENAYNLEGGIFNWRNENKILMRNKKPTKEIHPYNFYWGRLINDRKSIQYKPKNN